MSGKTFRVEHDFHASEAVELSIIKTDVVVQADENGEQDGWILVHKRGLPSLKGYVPYGYLTPLPSSAAPAPPMQPARSASPTRLGSSLSPRGRISSSPAPVTGHPENYEQAFEQHHSYIRDVLRRREQTFGRLETAIAAQQRRISELLDRNSQLTGRIVELDSRIEDERRRWREAIENEKKAVQQFTSSS